MPPKESERRLVRERVVEREYETVPSEETDLDLDDVDDGDDDGHDEED